LGDHYIVSHDVAVSVKGKLKIKLYYTPLADPDHEIANRPLSSEYLNGLTVAAAFGYRHRFVLGEWSNCGGRYVDVN
jgi:hypothetical protein